MIFARCPPRTPAVYDVVFNCTGLIHIHNYSVIAHPTLSVPSLQNVFPRWIQKFSMSQNDQAGLPACSITAANDLAGHFVKFKPCQSNVNGNQGHLIVMCHLVNEQGKPCQFFRWAPGSSKSPSASPPPSSTSTLPPAPITPVAGPASSRCLILGCEQMHIADDCLLQICHKHCVDQGSCISKKHKAAASLSLPPPPLSSDTTTILPPLSTVKPL
ncbi:hypothetical protein BDZ97DRAFT_1765260 [Flammula alnicola]|nr:hypothetical protein BDZ97DRAFT_1765260 [Flammula alnicola]